MESVQYSYEDYTWVPSLSHRLMGYYMLYPPKRRVFRHLLNIYRWLCNLSHIFCMILMLYTIFHGSSIHGIPLIIEYITLVTFAINSDIKFVTSLQYGDIKILSDKLAALYPKTTSARIDYQVNEYYWPRPLLIMIFIYFASTAMVAVGPFFQSVFIYFYRPGSEFLYLHYYPFFKFDSQHNSVWRYIGIYILEWCHASHMIVSSMATDLWLVCFQIQICLHFSHLIKSIRNFVPHRDHDMADRQFLANLVNKHNTLFDLQKELNGLYGGSLLFSLVTTSSLFCSVAVNIEIHGFSLEGVTLLMFMGTAVSQLYLICYYGQLVNTLSTDIAYSAYSHNWYNASLAYKKYLLIIATRAQQPVELSAMGYLPMSHDTFKLLMTVSYRLFALLRQMIQ